MKGIRIRYSAAELKWLEANRTFPIVEYHRAFCDEFGRDVSIYNLKALRSRLGWKTGRTGQFAKGSAPLNKGVRCAEGIGGRHPNAVATQFRKGNRTGRANLNYKPIGTERISREGYRERKIHDGLPLQSRWRAVHLLEWEAKNGPVPKGHCLKRIGEDKLNTDPSNWQLIPRALLPRLNGGPRQRHLAYDEAAPEVRPALLAVAKLEHQVRRRKRAEAEFAA